MAPAPPPPPADQQNPEWPNPPLLPSISNLTVPSPRVATSTNSTPRLPPPMAAPQLAPPPQATLTPPAPTQPSSVEQPPSDPHQMPSLSSNLPIDTPAPPQNQNASPNQLTDSHSTLQDSSELLDSHSSLIDSSRLEVDFSDHRARIGIGTYGAVYVGRYFGELVAVKRVRMPEVSPAQRDDPVIQARRADSIRQFAREIRRYERISHPGIVRFLGVTIPPDSSALLITELMAGGSLADAISTLRRARKPFQVSAIVHVALQACGGLRALHTAKCTWGDAKPDNILLSAPVEADGHFPSVAEARIADFGLSKCVEQSLLADTTLSGTGQPAGTYNYMAPEAFTGAEEDNGSGQAADMYSFGMVIYEMMTLRTPWRRKQLIEVFNKVMVGERPPWPKAGEEDYYDGIAEPLKQLVERCWTQDASARPTADEMFEELDRYSMTVSKRDEQRPVTEIASAGVNNGMPRVPSKQSTASTAIAICESMLASMELNGLESTRESTRYADGSDDEDKMTYDNAQEDDGKVETPVAPGGTVAHPRVSPVTSPEPRSLNQRYADRSTRSAAVYQINAQVMPQNSKSLAHSAYGPNENPQSSQDMYRKEHFASPVQHDLGLEQALRINLAQAQSHPHSQHDQQQILDNFGHNDLQHVPTTDFLKHRDEIALATAQAAANLSNVDDLHHNAIPNILTETPPTVGNTYDANTQDLTSSVASSTSLRRKRSKRLQSIIENAALAFLEIRRREDAASRLPPKLRKDIADKKALEEAKKNSENESLRVIETAKPTADFSAVLDQMRLHRDSHAVAKEGTLFLTNYCADENLYFDICEEGGVEEIVSAASLYGREDNALCITFCHAVTALSKHYDDKVGHLVRGVGVPSLVIELLGHHPTDVPLQIAGCDCLAIIAGSSELSRSAVATLGGPASVYRAMTKNNTSFKDIELAKAALRAICQIAQDNEKAAEFLVQVAALDTVSRAAEVFTNHNLESDILSALRAFSFYNGGRRNIIMSSGLKALTSIMLRNRDPEFMVACCTFIRAIARWRDLECEQAMLQSCVSERVTELMQMSNDIPGEEGARVAWYALHACTFLASFGSRSRKRLRLVGAIETALGVLSHRRENARVVRSATDALAELMKGEPESKLYAERYNAIALLNEALETHASIVSVRNALQWTLDHLTSTNGAPAGSAYSSRVYTELMNNMNGKDAQPQQGIMHVAPQQKPQRRFLGFNFGRRRHNAI